MKKLTVYYCGWGEDWPLGVLADDGRQLLFEYTPQALSQQLELSPVNLPLTPRSYGDFPSFQMRLPGLIADCLPDGWGLLLMDRLFRERRLPTPSPLDRLAFIGERAMGALRFVPSNEPADAASSQDLLAMADACEQVLAGETGATLAALARWGGSPQGARPKVLVQFNAKDASISTDAHAAGEPWLIKFQAQGEHKEVCAIEQLYAELARDCGLDMPASRWFDLSPSLAAFGVARFDRENGRRVPIHSLAGLLDVDYRLPSSADYTTFLRATRLLTRDEREVHKAFARAVFNVLFHNRDDHPKNFAWRMAGNCRWYLAPAFDLTFSEGPGGQHHMDVCGKGDAIDRKTLMRLASEAEVPHKIAAAILEQQLQQAAKLAERAQGFPIRKASLSRLQSCVSRCAALLM